MSEKRSHLRDLEDEILRLRRENIELKASKERERQGSLSGDNIDRAEIIFRTLLDQAQHLAGILDLDGVLRYANKTSRDFIGKDPTHFIGKKFWETPWWAHSKEIQEKLKTAIHRAAKGEFVQFETMLQAADGALRNLDFTLKPAHDEQGRIFCLIPEAWDITGRKQAEDDLDRARTLLDEVLGQSPVPTVVVSAPDLAVRYANRAAYDILGVSSDASSYKDLSLPEVFERQTWRELMPDGTPVKTSDLPIARALRGETTHNEEYIIERGDGERRWELVNGVPVYDRAGYLIAGVIVFADITRRKLAEEALEKRIVALTQPLNDTEDIAFEDLFNLPDIQHLQDLFAKVWGVAALITRPDGTPITEPSNFTHFCSDFVRKSPKGRANCARSDAMIGTNPSGPNVQTCMSAGLCNAGASIVVGGRHIANWLIGQVRNEMVDEKRILEYARVVDADETEFHEVYLTVPVMSQEQFELVAETLFVVASQLSSTAYQNILQARFITERKQAEEALRESEAKYRDLFENAPVGVFRTNSRGQVLQVNSTLARILGFNTPGEALERYHDLGTQLYVHAERRTEFLHLLKANGSVEAFEFEALRADGRRIWLSMDARIQESGTDDSFVIEGFTTDITERKQAEEALRESEEKLRAVLRGAPIAQFFIDRDHTVVYWNKAIEEYSGIAAGDIIGTKDHWKAFYPSARPCLADLVLDGNVPEIGKWYAGKYRESKLIVDAYEAEDFFPSLGEGGMWLYFTAALILDSNGAIIGALETLEDITERKQAVEALQASEKFLDTIIENSPFSTWISDANGIMIRMNQACRDLLNVTDHDLVGKYNLFEDPIIESQGLMPQIRNVFKHAETTRFVINYDSSSLRPHESAKAYNLILEVSISPVLDAQGRVMHAIIQHINITERVRSAKELEHRYEFERLVTGISTHFINLDPDEIDRAIEESLGLIGGFTGADRCVLFLFRKGTGTADSTHEWCAKGIESHMRMFQGLRGDTFPYINSFLVRSEVLAITRLSDFPPEHDAERFAFEKAGVRSFLLVPIEFKKEVVGFLGLDAVFEEKIWPPDIAALLRIAGEVFAGALERQQAEKALVLSEERFKRLVQNSNDIIAVMNEMGNLVSVTGPFERILGYAQGDLIGTNAFDLIHPDDLETAQTIFTELVRQPNTPGRAEFRYRHKNGSWITIEAVGNNLLNEPAIHGIVLNVRDISERNRLQNQLQQAMKMEAVGRLAGGVAHDFNNLLTSIICNVELAELGINVSDPLHQNLREVEKAAQSAATLTRQLLAFSRKQIIEPKVLNLNDLIRNIQKMLIRLIGEDISFKTTLSEDIGSVRIDAGQFEQVLVNLAVNARDAMPEGGVLMIETSTIDLDEGYCTLHPQAQPGKYVMIAVSDTGHGMTDEVKSHIFEPFYTTKAMGRGTGLGLATTFGAVQQAGGSIEVYSEVDHGTTFKIILPRTGEKTDVIIKETTPAEELRGDETILVVEDESGVRDMAAKVLELFGYNVLQAPNGSEALKLAEHYTGHIDLLMTDVVMPVMNGRELAERLVGLHPEMKVLYTSGYTENIIVHHGVIDKSLNFIAKPYSLQGLVRKIREVLGTGE